MCMCEATFTFVFFQRVFPTGTHKKSFHSGNPKNFNIVKDIIFCTRKREEKCSTLHVVVLLFTFMTSIFLLKTITMNMTKRGKKCHKKVSLRLPPHSFFVPFFFSLTSYPLVFSLPADFPHPQCVFQLRLERASKAQ